MDIIFNPSVNEENQYVRLLVDELHAKGYRIHPLDTVFSSRKHFRSIKLVHLNWFENIDDRSFFTALRSFLRKLVVLAAIRLSGKPLVWTMHNRASHERGMAFFSRTITRLLVRWSHRIVIHSQQSEAILASYGAAVLQQVVYIPHPHFINVYGEAHPSRTHGPDKLCLLFAGMVKPYKNLELLIDVVGGFGNRVQLTIAGKALNESYQQQVLDCATHAGNVTLLPYFVPDGEVAALLASADAVILPYDLASSLNSGTVLLAFSYKKTVICPEIGTISDLGAHMTDTLHYRYDTPKQHRTELKKQIARALELKQHNPTALDMLGQQLYEHVAATHDRHRIGWELDSMYQHLLTREK